MTFPSPWILHHEDCLKAMAAMESDSVDAIVCDPPYGLEFMGKGWDHGVPGVPYWQEALRVAKPGAYLLAFGGTRMYHRLAVAIEDAGWELRDCLSYLYGSGFPKSLDVSKAIDKAAGAERAPRNGTDNAERGSISGSMNNRCQTCDKPFFSADPCSCPRADKVAVTDAARQWDGWGTALKPAHEPVIVGYRPLTAEQFIGILSETIRSQLCQLLPASDAEKTFTDTRARSSEVASSVPESARIYELANSGNARFAARRFTSRPAVSEEERVGSAPTRAKASSNPRAVSETRILLGQVDDFLSHLTDTFTSGTIDGIEASIVLSWNSISDALLNQASTFTTSTGTRLTIALRTLSLFLSQITSEDTGSSSLDLKPAWEPIIVARKPLIGTVAANVLKYGTGGINIDACRIAHGADVDLDARQRQAADTSGMRGLGEAGYKSDHEQALYSAKGRWPANVILSHTPECQQVGTRTVKGGTAYEPEAGREMKRTILGATKNLGRTLGYADEHGNETIPAWECAPDCAVRLLDEQTGTLTSGVPGKRQKPHETNAMSGLLGTLNRTETGYADKGGASRFFLRVDSRDFSTYNESCEKTPGDTTESPTTAGTENGESREAANSTSSLSLDGCGSEPTGRSLKDTKSTIGTTTGQTTDSTTSSLSPSPGTTTTINESVKTIASSTVSSSDGANAARSTSPSPASSDERPEHTKATANPAPSNTSEPGEKPIESTTTPICAPIESGSHSRFFYTSKASRSERTHGGEVVNLHPTVKPIALMRWLVRLVTPPGGVVLDPFAGSGSTGVASILEGFSFVGCEMEAESVNTSRARLELATLVAVGGVKNPWEDEPAEAAPAEETPAISSIEDLFGFGE